MSRENYIQSYDSIGACLHPCWRCAGRDNHLYMFNFLEFSPFYRFHQKRFQCRTTTDRLISAGLTFQPKAAIKSIAPLDRCLPQVLQRCSLFIPTGWESVMAKLLPLGRSKSACDLTEPKGGNGVNLLLDLVEDDLPVLDFLNDYIQSVLDDSSHGNTEFYLRTHEFLTRIEQVYRGRGAQCPFVLLSFLRHVVMLLSETLFTSAQCDTCKNAVEEILVVPIKVKWQLRELASNVASFQDLALRLESNVIETLSFTEDHLVPDRFRTKTLITHTEQIWNLLRTCDKQLKVVAMAVEDKARSEQRFFQTASLSVGAVCAGRFLWSLAKGESMENVINAGLWSVCTGFSGVVLQIPRQRAKQVLRRLKKHKGQNKELQDLIKHWLHQSDFSYAKMVLHSPSNKLTF